METLSIEWDSFVVSAMFFIELLCDGENTWVCSWVITYSCNSDRACLCRSVTIASLLSCLLRQIFQFAAVEICNVAASGCILTCLLCFRVQKLILHDLSFGIVGMHHINPRSCLLTWSPAGSIKPGSGHATKKHHKYTSVTCYRNTHTLK